MLIDILLIIAGAVLVMVGADKLTDGAVGIARRFSIPELVIGLTIVAFGTSLPEFVVSLFASINHSPDLSVGNIVGSNIFNTLMILGCTAMVTPIVVGRSSVWRDIPFNLLITIVFVALILDSLTDASQPNLLSRTDGLVLLAFFVFFMYNMLSRARHKSAASADEGSGDASSAEAPASVGKLVLFVLLGLVGLIVGGEIFVRGARSIATELGVSEAVIGLTIVACGTSLPELATSIMAARKGSSGIAVGNVVGSNVFNVLWILGACSVVTPLPAMGLTMVDYATLVVSMVLFWLFARTGYRIARWQGFFLFAVFVAYMVWLLANV